ncbi:MAG: EF-hand domain-containing protein [Xanthomonadaceae bacterium]|nr:EF-hand domain-containing protein [Xanthomonadaceae bacterium]
MKQLIGALAALSLCTSATAGDKPQVAKVKVDAETFASLDRNADNQISRTEAGVDRELSDNFAYIDTDGDGFISRSEYLAQIENARDPT